MGHAQCEAACPEVFEVRDDGLAYIRTDKPNTDKPSDALKAKLKAAVALCPEQAVVSED